jgi:plasmid maintenance system antidote protein VapI
MWLRLQAAFNLAEARKTKVDQLANIHHLNIADDFADVLANNIKRY